jgi:hypothetical protein
MMWFRVLHYRFPQNVKTTGLCTALQATKKLEQKNYRENYYKTKTTNIGKGQLSRESA